MNTLVRLSLAWLLVAGAAQAQLPSAHELAMAVRATAAQARQAGLALQEGALWRIAPHHRTPLVAAHVQGACHLGYSACTPGRDYRWLFPTLTPALRARWMAGLSASWPACARCLPRRTPVATQPPRCAVTCGSAGGSGPPAPGWSSCKPGGSAAGRSTRTLPATPASTASSGCRSCPTCWCCS